MAIYVANHMIRHNGQLYQKGDEIKGLAFDDAQELLRHRAITRYGCAAPEPASTEVEAASSAQPAKASKTGKGTTQSPATEGGA